MDIQKCSLTNIAAGLLEDAEDALFHYGLQLTDGARGELLDYLNRTPLAKFTGSDAGPSGIGLASMWLYNEVLPAMNSCWVDLNYLEEEHDKPSAIRIEERGPEQVSCPQN